MEHVKPEEVIIANMYRLVQEGLNNIPNLVLMDISLPESEDR